MRYEIQFQYRPRGAGLPSQLPTPFAFRSDSDTPMPLPQVGDHVMIGDEDPAIRYVESRIYVYSGEPADPLCTVNFVLTDSELSNLGLLIDRTDTSEVSSRRAPRASARSAGAVGTRP